MKGIMVGMLRIRVGMRRIREERWGQGGNARNQGGNEENMGWECRGGIKIKGNKCIYKNIVLMFSYEKQLKKLI